MTLSAASLAGETNGDGTLATITFEVIAEDTFTLTLAEVLLSDPNGQISVPHVENAEISKTGATGLKGDVNGDGTVNISDLVLVASNLGQTGENAADVNGDGVVNIADLVLVAGALGTTAAAPSLHPQALEMLTPTEVKQWLSASTATRPHRYNVPKGHPLLGATPYSVDPPKRQHSCQTTRTRSILRRGYRITWQRRRMLHCTSML